MLSEADILKKVEELRANGSPASQVQLKQLEWVLGTSDDTDKEEEEILDFLLTNRAVEPAEELWSKLPSWVRDHQLYTFYKQKKATSKPVGINSLDPFNGVPRDNGYASFSWSKLLGIDAYKKIRKDRIKKKEFDAYDEGFYTRIPDESASIEDAELISSLQSNGKHKPLLDIDFEAITIPSTTPGHCHLYINKELDWKSYQKLLNVLADVGIIEHGYRGASLARGYSALRLPWVKKKEDEPAEIGRIS